MAHPPQKPFSLSAKVVVRDASSSPLRPPNTATAIIGDDEGAKNSNIVVGPSGGGSIMHDESPGGGTGQDYPEIPDKKRLHRSIT